MPTTFGTTVFGGLPLDRVRCTRLPRGTTEPPPGLWPMTVPMGALDGAEPSTMPEKFALDSTFSAWPSSSPITLGTVPDLGGGGTGQSSGDMPLVMVAITSCQISV